jgi:hypothetical protein
MKRKIIFSLCLCIIPVLLYAQSIEKTIDVTDKIKPVFSYYNWGGFFLIEKDKLSILEAVYKDAGNNNVPNLVGFVIINVTIGSEGKSSDILPVSLVTRYPSFISFKEFQTEWSEKIGPVSGDSGRLLLPYQDDEVEIDWDNTSAVNQHTSIFISFNNKKYKVIDIPSFYIWSKIVDRYLILVTLLGGGSGHSISLEIYDINEIVREH